MLFHDNDEHPLELADLEACKKNVRSLLPVLLLLLPYGTAKDGATQNRSAPRTPLNPQPSTLNPES